MSCLVMCSMFTRTSVIPKIPMRMGTIPIPSARSIDPKMNRCFPVKTSIPTVLKKRPKQIISRALIFDPWAR